jgi:hypothetical protein
MNAGTRIRSEGPHFEQVHRPIAIARAGLKVCTDGPLEILGDALPSYCGGRVEIVLSSWRR